MKTKLAVLNLSGNVGKTTLARDCFCPNNNNMKIVSLETINKDGEEETILSGAQGEDIFVETLINDSFVLDIGSSNVESFFNSTTDNTILEEIELFIVPTVSEKKQQFDTIQTVGLLIDRGIKPKNIKIVFNKIKDSEKINQDFNVLIEALNEFGVNVDTALNIKDHDLYTTGHTLKDLTSDVDFKKQMLEAKKNGNDDKAREFAFLFARQQKALKLSSQYQQINKTITK